MCLDANLAQKVHATDAFLRSINATITIESPGASPSNADRIGHHRNLAERAAPSAARKAQEEILSPTSEHLHIPATLNAIERQQHYITSLVHPKTAVSRPFKAASIGNLLYLQSMPGDTELERSSARLDAFHQQALDAVSNAPGRLKLTSNGRGGYEDEIGIVAYTGNQETELLAGVSALGIANSVGKSYAMCSAPSNDRLRRLGQSPLLPLERPGKSLGRSRYAGDMIEGDLNDSPTEILTDASALAVARAEDPSGDIIAFANKLTLAENNSTSIHGPLEAIIDLCLQNPAMLDDRDTRMRFIEVLSKYMGLGEVLLGTRFLGSRVEALNAQLAALKDQQQRERYLYLKFVCHLVYQHASHAPHKQETLPDDWPQVTAEDCVDFLSIHKDTKIDTQGMLWAATAAVTPLVFHPSIPDLDQHPILRVEGKLQTQNLKAILSAATVLQMLSNGHEVPGLAEQCSDWLTRHLSPWLNALDDEDQQTVLSAWAGLYGSEPKGRWLEVPEHSGRWICETDVLSIASLIPERIRGRPVEGLPGQLPSSIIEHPLYRRAMGNYSPPCTIQCGTQPNTLCYSFEARGVPHRAIHNSDTGALIVESMLVKSDRSGSMRWGGRFVDASCFENERRLVHRPQAQANTSSMKAPQQDLLQVRGEGIEQRIQDSGVWIDSEDATRGWVELGRDPSTPIRSERFKLKLSKSGRVLSMRSNEGLEVVTRPKEDLSKVIGPLHSSQTIYLRRPGQEWIREIRFLDQDGLRLKRSGKNGRWRVYGHKHLSGQPVLVGKQRPKSVNRLVAEL
ncbi:MAG: hypothetical protein KDK78_02700, partial [Chlamydiia bacterium]|nr:hypothetical protein [Chlamydiia bacterium]